MATTAREATDDLPKTWAEKRFKVLYESINATRYDGDLPAFPGVTWTDATTYGGMACATLHPDGEVELDPFKVSRHVSDVETLEEVIRHETAHAAVYVLEPSPEDIGHGPRWRTHAEKCGAEPDRTTNLNLGGAYEERVSYLLTCEEHGTLVQRQRRSKKVQKAFRGRLLCSKCETTLHVEAGPDHEEPEGTILEPSPT